MELDSLIDARPTNRNEVGAWYSELIAVADRAGISTANLADRLGCSRETIYAWRRRLTGNPSPKEARPSPSLVRLEVAQSVRARDPMPLEIRLQSGHSVLVPNSFDPAALASIVEVLAQC